MKFCIYVFLGIILFCLSNCARFKLNGKNILAYKENPQSEAVANFQEYFWVQSFASGKDAITYLKDTERFNLYRFIIVNAETLSIAQSADTRNTIESNFIVY